MTVTETKQATAGAKTTEERPDLLALDTPVVSLHIHRPQLRMPQVSTEPAERAVRAARSALPAPSRLAYWGGLGAMAAFGAIEWPVALAIGVGTAIGQRVMRNGKRAQKTEEPATEMVPKETTAAPRAQTRSTATTAGTGTKAGPKATPKSRS